MKKLWNRITFKSISGMVLMLLVFFAVITYIGFNSVNEGMMSQYSEGAFLTAETAVKEVDGDRLGEYLSSGGETPEYAEVWSRLDELCNSTGSTFIYVIQPDLSDYAHITFLFSTINHNSSYSVYNFGYVRNTTNDEYKEKYRRLYDLESERELVIRNNGFIETDPHITAMVGVKDSSGKVQAILCVQRQMDVLARSRQVYVMKILLTLIVTVLLIIIGQSLYLNKMVLKPLKKVSDETTRFSRENTVAEKKLQERIRNKDEIGDLAGSIDQMEEQIQDYIGSITRITAEKERINTELNLATKIQASMLPHDFPPFPERTEFDLYASMDPAKEVGGDFYDFFMVDDDHLCLVIADVSGKGVPAALFMMACKILLKTNATPGRSPADILSDVNAAVCANNPEEMFVTVWLGILEISTGKLTAANAGHEFPVVLHPGKDFELYKDKHGFVIGGLAKFRYKEYEITLEPGSKLFVYTDGVAEASNAQAELFGVERMVPALNECRDGTPEEVLHTVRKAVDNFVKDAPQFDDLTMLCLEYKGNGQIGNGHA